MRTPQHPFHCGRVAGEDGMTLIAVMLVMAVLLAFGVLGARSAQIELQIARNGMLSKQALDTAEAGLNHAYDLIKSNSGFNTELSNGGTGGVLAALGSVMQLDGNNYRFHAFGAGASDGYYVRVVDNHDEQAGADDPTTDMDYKVKIVSRGRADAGERNIEAWVSRTTPFRWAAFGKQYVKLTSGSSGTDSYDSRLGSYASTPHGSHGDVGSNGYIEISGVVNGDATASGTITGTVTGVSTPGAPAETFSPDPVPPCGPPYSPDSGISGIYSYTGSGAGELTVSGGNNATLTPGTYCFSTVTISGGSTLTVNGPVTMNLTGVGTFSGGGVVNTTAIPSNLQIVSSLVDPAVNGVKLSGGSDGYLTVYAPNTGIDISGGSGYFGGLLGSYVNVSGGSWIHYDDALGSGSGAGGLTGWHEVRQF